MIIASPDGSAKRAIYVKERGSLANSDHALIPIAVGDLVLYANRHRGDFVIDISRIVSITNEEATLEPVALFSEGEWDNPAAEEMYNAAINACMKKARCYHCREPHYIRRD